jgi:hypothetical protein
MEVESGTCIDWWGRYCTARRMRIQDELPHPHWGRVDEPSLATKNLGIPDRSFHSA